MSIEHAGTIMEGCQELWASGDVPPPFWWMFYRGEGYQGAAAL